MRSNTLSLDLIFFFSKLFKLSQNFLFFSPFPFLFFFSSFFFLNTIRWVGSVSMFGAIAILPQCSGYFHFRIFLMRKKVWVFESCVESLAEPTIKSTNHGQLVLNFKTNDVIFFLRKGRVRNSNLVLWFQGSQSLKIEENKLRMKPTNPLRMYNFGTIYKFLVQLISDSWGCLAILGISFKIKRNFRAFEIGAKLETIEPGDSFEFKNPTLDFLRTFWGFLDSWGCFQVCLIPAIFRIVLLFFFSFSFLGLPAYSSVPFSTSSLV